MNKINLLYEIKGVVNISTLGMKDKKILHTYNIKCTHHFHSRLYFFDLNHQKNIENSTSLVVLNEDLSNFNKIRLTVKPYLLSLDIQS